ncbi:sulfotransferase [bacterium]|nr:sulfotransferase [bacterium]
MELNKDINYIVSGLERSGTSMLMQMLRTAGVPTAYDRSSRPPDENNPKGYYELEGGKIINKLMEKSFPLQDYKGKFIKITAYGLKFLPPGAYRIIYSERNIEEIMDSMEKMTGNQDKNRKETRELFLKLNEVIKRLIRKREDTEVLMVNYNQILDHPDKEIRKICDFLGISPAKIDEMVNSVDKMLYRERRK